MSCERLLAADHPISAQTERESQHIHLTPVPTAAREARSFVRSTADVLEDDRLDDLLVLTSEVVTNAVLHARTPVELGITVTDDAVLVCVADGADGTPRHQDQSDGRESGRGIMLVRELADEWGVLPHDTKQGKAVWFLFRRRAGKAVGIGA
jgi:anti-sigma regulatory factor (Ser/Thr protein kinase)